MELFTKSCHRYHNVFAPGLCIGEFGLQYAHALALLLLLVNGCFQECWRSYTQIHNYAQLFNTYMITHMYIYIYSLQIFNKRYVYMYICTYIYIYTIIYIHTYLFIFGTLCSAVFLSWDEDHPPMGSNIAWQNQRSKQGLIILLLILVVTHGQFQRNVISILRWGISAWFIVVPKAGACKCTNAQSYYTNSCLSGKNTGLFKCYFFCLRKINKQWPFWQPYCIFGIHTYSECPKHIKIRSDGEPSDQID